MDYRRIGGLPHRFPMVGEALITTAYRFYPSSTIGPMTFAIIRQVGDAVPLPIWLHVDVLSLRKRCLL
jgi:hypothetical protein